MGQYRLNSFHLNGHTLGFHPQTQKNQIARFPFFYDKTKLFASMFP